MTGYGLLKQVTLPTGGSVSATYANFTDSYHNTYRWVSNRTSGSGTWTYTPAIISYCSTGGTGCQQKVTVASPAGDNVVHTFTHNNGAWNTQTAYYTGSSGSGTLLDTVTTDYDFSNSCPSNSNCTTGAAYIRPYRFTTTYPVAGGNISRKTELSFDNPQYGNVIEARDWKYYTGTPPSTADRITDTSYVTAPVYINASLISLPVDVLVKDGGGNKVAESALGYDSTSLTSITGITHHDDTNYGAGNYTRGNPTVVQQWVSGTTYLTQTDYYDTTGQLVQTTDPHGTNTTYSFADSFATDNGNTPPAGYTPATPTNAYVTQVNLLLSGTKKFGYYFGSGNQAFATDQNNNSSYSHFTDPLDRMTSSIPPGSGGQSLTYTSFTQTDIYSYVGGQSRHNTVKADNMARVNNNTFTNDPGNSNNPAQVNQTFDTTGRVASATNPYRSISDPSYGVQSYAYDGLNRSTLVTNTDGTTSNTYYGASVTTAVGGITTQLCTAGTYGTGFPTFSVDASSKKRETWSDGFGRVIEVDEPDSSNNLTVSTCYQYDLNNNLSEIDQGSETRTYTHDGLSRATSETSPEEGASGSATGTTIYSYTTSGGGLCAGAASAVCYRTDARGVTITFTYDAENRLTGKSYNDTPQTPAVTYSYDQSSYNGLTITNGLGHRTGMADGSGQVAWSYNVKGEVLTEKRTIGTVTKTISYNYNSDGSLQGITYPNGNGVGYGYDSAGQPTSASGFTYNGYSINWASVSAFAPNGGPGTISLDGDAYSYGDIVNYIYDVRFRPSRMQANPYNGQNFLDLSFNYWQNSNVHVVTNNLDNTRTTTYAFDNLNRISTASSQATSGANCWGQSYSYDRYGNLTAINSTQCTSPTMSVTVNAKNQVTNSDFTYDSGGNLTSDGVYIYTWDAENRLTTVNGLAYTYDGDGKRVMKSNGTIYWYDLSGNVLEETDASGNRLSAYIYFGGKRVGRYDPSGAHYAYLSDLIGSSVMVTDSMGHIQNSSDYYPFGGERHVTSTLPDHYKFTGMERDSESGLDHTLIRQFTSTYGRWLSPDPDCFGCTNPQKLNRYAYVFNNPVTLTDPFGLEGGPVCSWLNPDCDSGDYGGPGGHGGPCSLIIRRGSKRFAEVSGCGGGDSGGGPGLTKQKVTRSGSLTDSFDPLLKTAIANLSSNCQKFFDTLSGGTKALSSSVSNLQFFDGTGSTGDGALNASTVLPGASNETLNQYVDGSAAVVLSNSSGISNGIVIGSNFKWENTTQQGTTLVHEDAHYAYQLTDQNFQNQIQQYNPSFNPANYGMTNVNSASQFFTAFLSANCPPN